MCQMDLKPQVSTMKFIPTEAPHEMGAHQMGVHKLVVNQCEIAPQWPTHEVSDSMGQGPHCWQHASTRSLLTITQLLQLYLH